jgi:hypothetical protein
MKPYLKRWDRKPRAPQQPRDPGSRVYESTSAKGKIRGTAQQLVERYLQFAEEARLANDRVASEAFLQSAEHYVRVGKPAHRVQDHPVRDRSFRRAPMTQGEPSPNKETQRDEPMATVGPRQAPDPELIRLEEARERMAAEKRKQTEAAEKRAAAAAYLERIARQHGYTLEQLGLVLLPA